MTKALLPALLASLFAVTSLQQAAAAERELLFGAPGAAGGQAKSRPSADDESPEAPARKRSTTPARKQADSARVPLFGPVDIEDDEFYEEPRPARTAKKPSTARPPVATTAAPKPQSGDDKPSRTSVGKIVEHVRTAESGKPAPAEPAKTASAPAKPTTPEAPKLVTAPRIDPPKPVPPSPVTAPSSVVTATPGAATTPGGVKPTAPIAATPAPVKPVEVAVMPPMPADLPPVAPVSLATRGDDPFADRQELMRKLNVGSAMGFFPGTHANPDVYQVGKNVLPLANHLSAKTGVAFNPLAERDVEAYRRRLLQQDYPLAYIHLPLVDAALRAGYEPLAVSDAKVSAAIVVRSDANISKAAELKDRAIALAKNAESTPAGLALLATEGVTSAQFSDIGFGGTAAAVRMLTTGVAQAAILSDTEAATAVKNANGSLTVIGRSAAYPAFMVVARKGAYDEKIVSNLRTAFTSLGRTGSRAEQFIIGSLARGTNLPTGYSVPSPQDLQATQALSGEIARHWPDFFGAGKADEAQLAKGSAGASGLYRLTKGASGDPFSEHARLAQQFRETAHVAFASFVHGSADAYTFGRTFLPLANQLSKKAGMLVSLVPERDIGLYRSRLASADYTIAFVDARLAADAAAAGYVPVLRTKHSVAAAIVVRANSDIRQSQGLAGKRVAWGPDSTAASFAYAYLTARNVRTGAAVHAGTTVSGFDLAKKLQTGEADAVILRDTEAEQLASDPRNNLRILEKTASYAPGSIWVRKDQVDSAATRRVIAAFQAADADRLTTEGFLRSYKAAPVFVATSQDELQGTIAAARELGEKASDLAHSTDASARLLQMHAGEPVAEAQIAQAAPTQTK